MSIAHPAFDLALADDAAPLPSLLARTVWALVGTIALILGLIGIALPVLPGAPLLLLAGPCFANVSERLHDRLSRMPALRAPLARWQRARSASVSVQARTAIGLVALGVLEIMRIASARLRR